MSLKTWVEDFVDEDTGEVVSIERNEVVIDRETVLEEEHVDIYRERVPRRSCCIKRSSRVSIISIIYNTAKGSSNSEKEAVVYIYRQLRNAEPAR